MIKELKQSDLHDFDKCKKNIGIKMINAKNNRTVKLTSPCRKMHDTLITYYIAVNADRNGIHSMHIDNTILDEWGISMTKLHEQAMKSNRNAFGISVMDIETAMNQVLNNESDNDVYDSVFSINVNSHESIYVATNAWKIFGASVILYNDILNEVADKLNDDLYILPSSIHEALLIGASNCSMDIGELKKMVIDTNANPLVMSKNDILSNNVYFYEKYSNKLKIA